MLFGWVGGRGLLGPITSVRTNLCPCREEESHQEYRALGVQVVLSLMFLFAGVQKALRRLDAIATMMT